MVSSVQHVVSVREAESFQEENTVIKVFTDQGFTVFEKTELVNSHFKGKRVVIRKEKFLLQTL